MLIRLVLLTDSDLCGYKIKMGASLQDALRNRPNLLRKQSLETLIMETRGRPFIVIMSPVDKTVNVVLSEHASHGDIIEAYVRSILVAYLVRSNSDDEDASKTRSKNKISLDSNRISTVNIMLQCITQVKSKAICMHKGVFIHF